MTIWDKCCNFANRNKIQTLGERGTRQTATPQHGRGGLAETDQCKLKEVITKMNEKMKRK